MHNRKMRNIRTNLHLDQNESKNYVLTKFYGQTFDNVQVTILQ